MNFRFHKVLKAVPWFILLCILTFIDQISKYLIINNIYGKEIKLLGDVFVLRCVYNYGAAFGMFTNKRYFFIIIAIIVLISIFIIFLFLPSNKRFIYLKISIILLSAGAIGNMIDRIIFGYVRDFLYFKLINFPIFNIADTFIVISSIALVYLVCFYYKESDFKKIKTGDKDE